MQELEQKLLSPVIISKALSMLWVIIALVGFVDATYLTVEHYSGGEVACSIVKGCNVVLTSPYSTIGPIPVALLGAAYYVGMLIGMIAYVDTRSHFLYTWLPRVTIAGFVLSLWFVYVQVFLLQSYCQYCLLSAVTSTVLWLISLRIQLQRKAF